MLESMLAEATRREGPYGETGRIRAAIPALLLVLLWACAGGITTPAFDDDELGAGGSGAAGAAGRSTAGTANAGSNAGARGGSGGGAGTMTSGRSGAEGGERPDAGGVGTNEPPREYCDAVTDVFQVSCGTGSCHSNRGATIGDFAVGPEEAAAYVSRGSVRDPECGLIIDPRDPKDSLILTKVTGEYPSEGNCGGPMPVGSIEITDEQIDCIADWVEQFGQ
jgi:hypothetical protein